MRGSFYRADVRCDVKQWDGLQWFRNGGRVVGRALDELGMQGLHCGIADASE